MRNPYLEAMGWRMENGERTGAGNGAGCFIYPPEKCFARDAENRLTGELGGDGVVFDAPVGSIRLEMVRDGIEDYEYLARLRSLDPDNALLKIPSGIFASPDRYAKDPEPIENHRLKLAREIERLTKKNKED
jgi:hypothetical protein